VVNHLTGHAAIDADVLTRDEASLVAAKTSSSSFLKMPPTTSSPSYLPTTLAMTP